MESTRQNDDISAIKDVRKLFSEVRSNLSREETKRIRKKLYKKAVYNFLKEKEQEGSLTNKKKGSIKEYRQISKEYC